MPFRGIPKAAECQYFFNRGLPWSQCATWSQRIPPWSAQYPFELRMGAKKKTVLSIDSLPQGQLPALEPEKADIPPSKGYPPTLQQHLNNVRKFKDCVVLTRVGDFYELYFDQVDEFAPLLNLKKAMRSTVLGNVPMAGFQYTALDRYVKTLVLELGQKVAISEQVKLSEDERQGSNLYERKVNRVVTAGTLVDESFVDPYENNYLLAIHLDPQIISTLQNASQDDDLLLQIPTKTMVGLSWLDLPSGEFNMQLSDLASLTSLVARISPREVVLDLSLEPLGLAVLQRLLGDGRFALHFHHNAKSLESMESWSPMLETPMPQALQQVFSRHEVCAAALVLDYVRDKMLDHKIRLQTPISRSNDEFMVIDKQSLRGLEIRRTLRDGAFQGSLLHTMRQTVTKSGARLLADRLVSPSMSLSVINERLDLVQELSTHSALREDITALLMRTTDTVRLMQRFSIGKGDADDLLGLAKTIDVMNEISASLNEHVILREASMSVGSTELDCLRALVNKFELKGPTKVAEAIQSTIDEGRLTKRHAAEDDQQAVAEEMTEEVVAADATGNEAKFVRKAAKSKASYSGDAAFGADDIWIMKSNTSPTLERAHADLTGLLQSGKDLEERLRAETKAASLSLKWTAQLGHHCYVKTTSGEKSIKALVGTRIIGSRRTSCTFYLAEWTHLGSRIDDSKLRIRAEEERVFNKLRAEVIENIMKLRRNASLLDHLDVACSSAKLASTSNLVRPILDNSTTHHIIGGRHPTVDAGLKRQGRDFTANDCSVGEPSERIYLLTGPNMAGKSTYLRQNALITILAQTGHFVPARYARLGLVDRIFSRVGAGDNLYQDQSTFMVEMLETAEILSRATPRSFVVMDEVGRGTTPEDGVAVAYACLRHLHDVNRCRTLFATHFHRLADLSAAGGLRALKPYCTDVVMDEASGRWWYDHRVRKGVNRESHALKVARKAGMPETAIEVAEEMLRRGGREWVDQKEQGEGQRDAVNASAVS